MRGRKSKRNGQLRPLRKWGERVRTTALTSVARHFATSGAANCWAGCFSARYDVCLNSTEYHDLISVPRALYPFLAQSMTCSDYAGRFPK